MAVGNAVRLYMVREMDKDGNHERMRIVKAKTPASAIRFCAKGRFEAEPARALDVGAMMAAGATIEDASAQE